MRKNYFNVSIDVFNKGDALKQCAAFLQGNVSRSLFFVNAHCFNIVQRNPNYGHALENADLILNDGIGMKLGSYLAKVKLHDNLNGTDLIPQIISMGWQQKMSFYLLGSTPETLINAKKVLEDSYPGISIAGLHHGFFDEQQGRIIIQEITTKKIDILIVGMGVPRQELWINSVKNKLENVKLFIAGGAILDFISGKVRRAPLWVRRIHMEWLFRLYLEPLRLWERYMLGNLLFLFYVVKFKVSGKYKNEQNRND